MKTKRYSFLDDKNLDSTSSWTDMAFGPFCSAIFPSPVTLQPQVVASLHTPRAIFSSISPSIRLTVVSLCLSDLQSVVVRNTQYRAKINPREAVHVVNTASQLHSQQLKINNGEM
jgi:hypothetical protein